MSEKKTGIELIAEERQEQITKHGWTAEHDQDHYAGELILAALYCLNGDPAIFAYRGWEWFKEKVDKKTEIEKQIVAGALIAANIDRLQNEPL